MKKVKLALSLSVIVLLVSFIFVSCKKTKLNEPDDVATEPGLPATPYNYFDKHNVNSDMATLGRVLFYDRNLSVNNAISCGSCHKQEFAFADNVKFNKGFNGLELKRNSPSIQGNHGFNKSETMAFVNGSWIQVSSSVPDKNNQLFTLLFWDGRQTSLADMVLNPVLNHNEMNMPDFETLVTKLAALPYYNDLFTKAYGDGAITKERIAFAMESFISCLNTTNPNVSNTLTPTNPNQFGNANTTFTSSADLGKFLFHNKYNCAKCHDPSHSGSYDGNSGSFNNNFNNGGIVVQDPLKELFNFSNVRMFNIGLDEVVTDPGLGRITGKSGDQGLFKVPTLKNISVTAPYMHDGRFANLSEVIDHYSHNIKANKNLTAEFLNFDGTPKRLNILPIEKEALIAFLNTLRDDDFLTSPMYSDPFKK